MDNLQYLVPEELVSVEQAREVLLDHFPKELLYALELAVVEAVVKTLQHDGQIVLGDGRRFRLVIKEEEDERGLIRVWADLYEERRPWGQSFSSEETGPQVEALPYRGGKFHLAHIPSAQWLKEVPEGEKWRRRGICGHRPHLDVREAELMWLNDPRLCGNCRTRALTPLFRHRLAEDFRT